MRKKNEIRGNLYIQMPQPFRRQQLSLSAQKKNKQIRLKLEELNQKRSEHQELEQRWQEQKQNYEQFLNYHIQLDRALKIKEQRLRKQVFKLSIRKEQIESKTNPEIGLSKMKKLVQYLRCVPFTLGNYYEKVILWNGQREYLRYKFLLGYFVDRALLRTEAQRHIKKNISNIVYCSKVKFEGEWIMVTLKLVDPQIEQGQLQQLSQGSNKTSRNVYELSVYAITGKYFCYRKNYRQQQLERWSDILQKNERQHRRHKQSRNTDENRRSSMAKMLAANCFKEISNHHKEHKSHHQRCAQIEQHKIEADNIPIAQASDGKTIEEENQSQNNSHRQSALHGWSQNSVDANINLANIYNEENSDSSLHRDESVSSNDSSEQVQKTTQKESLSTKKNVKSKSFFYSQTKYSENRFKTLNKHFLGGGEENLFPAINPLLNVVILKEQNEIYLLQDYLQIKQKLQIINIALSRYRLKMKMRKELRKCLFYRVIQFEDFYETKLKYEDKITLPIIFMVKKTDQKHKELRLSCTALAHHPRVQSILNFSHTFYRQRVVAQKLQAKDNRRISNNKLIKNGGRKSKQTKRRTISKNMLKSIEYEKSAFHCSKTQNSQAYAAFIRQKFDQFLKDNVICIQRQCFIAVEKLKGLSRCLIRLQAILRKKMQLQRYRQTKKQIVSKYRYFPELKILLTARTSLDDAQQAQQVKVVLQNVNQCVPPIYKCNTYLHKYKDTIFDIIDHFQLQSRSQQQYLILEQQIQLGIDLQDQHQAVELERKPAKQRAALVRFLRMLLIRKKRKANIYFIRKMVIKDRLFVLIIRRNNRIRSLLECNLYDFPAASLKSTNSDTISETNCFKIQYPHSSKQFSQKSYRYQKIHLHEKYFEGIERRVIADQFLIDYHIFLLKPAKQPSIHFIDRLCPFDINYDDINKELSHMERQQVQDGSNYKNTSQLSQLVSSKSANNSSMVSNNKKSNEQRLAVEKESRRYNVAHYEHKKLNKKISLIERNKDLPTYARHNMMKDYGLQHTAQSVMESTGQKSKQTFKIAGNSHESIIYFSLYKAKDIFFYLDIYLVSKQLFKCGYSEQLERVATQRIYKKQLEELGTQIVVKKIAEWLHKNEERLLETADGRERNEEIEGKIELEGGLNMVGRCLQFLDSNAKRFSQTIAVNVELLEKQRSGRTNTLNL